MLLTKLQTLHNNRDEMCFDLAFNNNTAKVKEIKNRALSYCNRNARVYISRSILI